ncbi:PTS system cellobiose-specific IIB component [Halanaerobium saccharolyticum]|uniref:PTS system cellobiose-specific IIB component n=1 Tax=Halanaerobium saccharolyticum TaxID=43595 RepID=A0A4R6L962_9FIRM|nr:PTS sugar transporter subunit IIB [Halanaerobium saccharolyticum]TDO71339.1 PTS system cellobiose-specific IIB component [Halanaerobium saccharolyticum]
MENVVLVCTAGMSTSILVSKMNKIAAENEIEINIEALAQSELKNYSKKIDLILLGPQVKYLLNNLERDYKNSEIKFDVIDSVQYGTLNGKAVLNHALTLLDKKVI